MKEHISTGKTDYSLLKNFTDCKNIKYIAPPVSAAGANVWYLPNVCTH